MTKADQKRIQKTIRELVDNQANDQRLLDHMLGVAADQHFPSLTWYWGPILYRRNRVVFGPFIHDRFSSWDVSGGRWRPIRWAQHADVLEPWLAEVRSHRDTKLARRLLSWKFAGNRWGLDEQAWRQALLADYQAAPSPAQRITILAEYDDWFQLTEDTALALYHRDTACKKFIIRHLPNTFWGSEKRTLWQRLLEAAERNNDLDLYQQIYQRQVPLKQWQTDVLAVADRIASADQLCQELAWRHPVGYGFDTSKTLVSLLERRGRDVMPYVRSKLPEVAGGWHGSGGKPFAEIARRHEWWDLWAAAIRTDRDSQLFNKAVAELLVEANLPEDQRMQRLTTLAGVSREWNWTGFSFARVHFLEDAVAVALYQRYPQLVHGPFKPNVTPTWWKGYPELLAAARSEDDQELIDLIASRYALQHRHHVPANGASRNDPMMDTVESLTEYYQTLRDQAPDEFARRAANVLTRIPAYAIHYYQQLLRSNSLARLFFVRSFRSYLAAPEAIQDLVEGADIHVQMLAYRILGQDDDRATTAAVAGLEVLIGTLTRPLHRKTRIAAFSALHSAGRHDANVAKFILVRAKEALRLPDKLYPKEELIGLIGQLLHHHPELQAPCERPIIYGLAEATA
ncbi:MAG: hypothetical protein R3C28_23675 [Pirellulaceae bacterium]